MNIRQRLFELGITPGTKILTAFSGIYRDPVAYYVKGAVIALRREDAELIEISLGDEKNEEQENGAV